VLGAGVFVLRVHDPANVQSEKHVSLFDIVVRSLDYKLAFVSVIGFNRGAIDQKFSALSGVGPNGRVQGIPFVAMQVLPFGRRRLHEDIEIVPTDDGRDRVDSWRT
jgi:hypothetical protein